MSAFVREDNQGKIDFVSDGDVVLESDRDQNGVGDFVVKTAGVERGRIAHDGTASGVFAGGSSSLAALLASSTDAGAHRITDLIDPSSAQDAATKNYVDTAVSVVTGTSQSGATYTLVLADKGTVVGFTAACTVTVPPNSSVSFPVGAQLELYQAGTGTVTVAGGAGVTLHSPGGTLTTASQYATLVLRQVATDVWVVGGELTSTAVDEGILTTKGDLIVATAASTPARLGVGADGQELRADSTQTDGMKWVRPKGDLELQLAALGLCSANFHPAMVAANSSPVSQSAYLLRVPLRQGMAITGLQILIGTAAAGTAPTGIFVGLADTTGKVLVQSGNLNGTAWTSTGFLNLSFGSTYTVPSDGSYYAFILVNGTWGTTQPTLQRLGGTMIDDTRVDARQGGVSTPPANNSSFTPANTSVLHFWVGCVGS